MIHRERHIPRLITTPAGALLLLWCLLLTGSSSPLQGQAIDEEILGTIRFSSDASSTVYILSFGVGSDYTDTTDREHEEFIPPFLPPGDYLAAFDRECTESDGDPPCYFRQDFRGIPDSVVEKGLTQFSVNYRIRVRNLTGQGLRLAIRNADWPDGLDSLHIVDAQLASAYDETFTGPAVTALSDPQTSWLNVTAYYNLATASVSTERIAESRLLGELVNPVEQGILHLSSSLLQSGGRLMLISPDGRRVLEHDLGGVESEVALDRLPAGLYYLLYFDRSGRIAERRSLVLLR